MSKIEKYPQTSGKVKPKYKLKNWSAYNKALERRGNITLYFSDEVTDLWYAPSDTLSKHSDNKPGGQQVYSDECIALITTLKVVFKLPYRQVAGFTKSLLKLMQLDKLKVPSYTQICRRTKGLQVPAFKVPSQGPIDIAIDSTGVKIFGEGEWKVRKHGISKRRTWRKLHLGVNVEDGFIACHTLTCNDVDDASQLHPLLNQVAQSTDEQSIARAYLDGAYDTQECWDTLVNRKIQPVIPPREGAVEWHEKTPGDMQDYPRNVAVRRIGETDKKTWKKETTYHKRNLSETAMYRYKIIHGSTLYSREFERQKAEVAVKIKVLNIMTAQGTPESYKVEVN